MEVSKEVFDRIAQLAEPRMLSISAPMQGTIPMNRLGSADVHKASGISQLQENVISIAVKFQGDQFEPKADKLLKRLQSSGFRQAGVVLHPRANK